MTQLGLSLGLSCWLCGLRRLSLILIVVWFILLICMLCPCISRSSLLCWIIVSILGTHWGSMAWLMTSVASEVVISRHLVLICNSFRSWWVILSWFVVEFKELWVFVELIKLLMFFIRISTVGLFLIVSIIAINVIVVVWEGRLTICIGCLLDFLEFNTCFNQTLIATGKKTN